MLVEVRSAYNREGLEALLEVNDEQGIVRAKSPNEGSEQFWLGRGVEYRTWLRENERTASNLLRILTSRVCIGHIYQILQQPDGSLVPDDEFDSQYERLLAEHGPAVGEYILRTDRGISLPGLPARRP
jgi:hypothetical protein